MQYVLNENFAVIKKGNSPVANISEGEFLLDESLNKATLIGVAEKYKVPIKSRDKVSTIFENIIIKLNERKFKMSEELDQYLEVVQAGVDAGKEETDICIDLVTVAGLPFNKAGSMYKKCMIELGLMKTPAQRQEEIADLVSEHIPEVDGDYTKVEALVELITEQVSGTTKMQALSTLRKLFKEAELEFPKKQKASTGGSQRNSWKASALQWLLDNKDATREDIEKFVASEEKRPVFVGELSSYLEFGRRFAAAD